MREIIYYVAASLDGYIAGPNEDISGFVQGGNGVAQYMQDLQAFDTVIMGRNTYEFGYQFGLKPGQPAYAHMKHYIFSDTLKFENAHENVHVCPRDIVQVKQLKASPGGPIYLCGGGVFAGWLLEHALIDQLKLKLNPFLQGAGIKIFGSSSKMYKLKLLHTACYDEELHIITYAFDYGNA